MLGGRATAKESLLVSKVNQAAQRAQISSLDALLSGLYDGEMAIGDLKQYGDFGLGTYEALDGEM